MEDQRSSSSPPSVPIEWVDEEEFEAMERALALASSASKRSKTSAQEDSTGRRLPGLNNHPAQPSSSNTTFYEGGIYLNTDHCSANLSPEPSNGVQAQPEFISSSNNAVGALWGFARPPCRVTSKPRLPAIQFNGHIIYSKTKLEVEKATSELLQIVESKKCKIAHRLPLGFDIEWRPSFRRGEMPRKAAVLQICVDADRCDVMHIIHSGIPPLLRLLLEDESSVKVGVCIAGDALKLHKDYNVRVRAIEDISGLANRKLGGPPKRWSLSSLMEGITCKQVDKPGNIRMGDWEIDTLSKSQLQYAATDAFASWYLYEMF